jgi:predicted RNA binding protein with dsRBD fold (UPF0201 family)
MTDFHQLRSTFAFMGTNHLRAALMFAAVLLAIMPLHAQETAKQPGPTSEQQEMQQAYQQAHADFMAVQQRLKQIQHDTLEAHPELQKQEQSFNELLMEEMKNKGYNPKQDLAEIEKLQQQLQSGDLSDSEREALMAKFQEKMTAFRKAQSEALQTKKVQQAQGDLMGAMITAMKEQDPQTEQLMHQMTQKRQELEQMLGTASKGK